MSTAVNQRPDLFAAALPGVGHYDMLRFPRFTGGKLFIGEVIDPAPWAREASASFLIGADATCDLLKSAGFGVITMSDDLQKVMDWFAALQAAGLPPNPNLGVVLGPDFPIMAANLARNLREAKVGIVTIVAQTE